MATSAKRNDIIEQLQREILSMQGLRDTGCNKVRLGIEPLEQAFPGKTFPVAAVHEFLSYAREEAAATSGFITGLLSRLMQKDAYCIWVAVRRTIYPPALKRFGIDPDRILFIDVAKSIDALWVVEEALKCDLLAAVVGEVPDLSFTQSRRLQLAVEGSKVTGLIHRYYPRNENAVACVSRWHIKPVPSQTEDEMPGVGFPRWEVTLSRIRNGHPGTWHVAWTGGRFKHITTATSTHIRTLQTGLYG